MTIQTLKKKFKAPNRCVGSPEVRWLYTHLPPLPIENEKDHGVYKRVVAFLLEHGKTRGELRRYLNAVIHFVDEYEKVRFPGVATPEDVLRFLMEQHQLAQRDLAGDLGGQSVVSEVLAGKRRLTREHIEKLGQRFGISAVSFFQSTLAV